MNSSVVRRAAAALLVIGLCACTSESSPATADAKTRQVTRTTDESSAGTVDLGGDTYQPGTLSAVGAVTGVITFDGVAPPDTTPVPADQTVCGKTITDAIETGPKGTLADAVVWIADVKTGAALPIEKRVALSSEDCRIEPRVQATVVGSTVNVFNDDRALHRLIFLRLGTHDTLATMPFFNDGEVVPSEKLAKTSGIVEVRCALHPWTHGYLAVFDHPYFAVTEKNGAFKIDSLPPGNHRLMVWREGMTKPVEQAVTVQAGGVGAVNLAIK